MNFASRAEYRDRIEKVVIYIHDHISEPLDLHTVAEVSHFSPYHFHRVFHGAMGETPQDYINRLRLERAANYLTKAREMSITNVAMACGFSSPSTFARSFKQHFGVTARECLRGRYLSSLADACGSQVCTMTVEDRHEWNVNIREVPAMHLAYLTYLKGYNPVEICKTWERLDTWAISHSAYAESTLRLGISMDDPLITPAGKCRYMAAITIPPAIKKDRVIGILDVPAMTCAIFHVTCRGDEIQRNYQAIYKDWLPDSGMQPADFPCYEVYRDVSEATYDGIFNMDIYIPLKPM